MFRGGDTASFLVINMGEISVALQREADVGKHKSNFVKLVL